MLESTILNILTAYRINLCSEKNHTEKEREIILKRISECQNFLNNGSEVNEKWMTENYSILSKAVKNCYCTAYLEECGEEERQDLNKCMTFYKVFYEKMGIDF